MLYSLILLLFPYFCRYVRGWLARKAYKRRMIENAERRHKAELEEERKRLKELRATQLRLKHWRENRDQRRRVRAERVCESTYGPDFSLCVSRWIAWKIEINKHRLL